MTREESLDAVMRALPYLTDNALEHLAGYVETLPRRNPGGVAAIFGQWPGDETDDEVARALEDIS